MTDSTPSPTPSAKSIIEELMESHKATTQGEWYFEPEYEYITANDEQSMIAEIRGFGSGEPTQANGRFIVLAHTRLPALAEEMARVLARLEAAEAERDTYKRGYEGREKAKQMWFKKAQERQKEIYRLKGDLLAMQDLMKMDAENIGKYLDQKHQRDSQTIADLQIDRDEWKEQHENLLAMYRESEQKFQDLLGCFEAAESEWAEIIVGITEIREAFKRANADEPAELVEALIDDDVVLHSVAGCIDGLVGTVGRLRQQKEAAEAKAEEFATMAFCHASKWPLADNQEWMQPADTLHVSKKHGEDAAAYLHSIGLLERHPEHDWYRWLPQEAEEVKG